MKKIKLILIIIFSVLTINFCIGQSQELIVNAASLPQVNENVNRVNSNIDDTRNELISKLNTIINNLINGGEAGANNVWYDIRMVKLLNEIKAEVNNIQSAGGGQTAQDVKDIKQKVDSIDVKKEATDAINEVAKYENPKDTKDDIFKTTNFMLEKINKLYRIPFTILKAEALDESYTAEQGEINLLFWNVNYELYSQKSPFTTPFYAFAYSIVLLFFAINLTESTLKYEIMTPRGALSILGRIAISKLWVDLSGYICLQILKIISYLILKIESSAFSNLNTKINNFTLIDVASDITLNQSNIKFVGPLIDTCIGLILAIGFLLVFIVMIILAGIILIKLAIRSIELAIMMVVSPIFFACYATETTKQYFRNFIITFIQIAAQLLYMTILIFIAFSWSSTSTGNVTNLSSALELIYSATPSILIFVMLAIMIVKPPKFLTNLIH